MSSRKPIVGGNWKCNGTVASVGKLVQDLNDARSQIDTSKVDVVVAPAAIHLPLPSVMKELDHAVYKVSAQNAHHTSGAFTGEISLDMLQDFGIHWVIYGHSERRHVFNETDAMLSEKTKGTLRHANKFNIIGCIGETLQERQSGQTLQVCERQMRAYCDALGRDEDAWSRFVIAYEPVWAIGTGQVATPEQAQEVHADLRAWIARHVSQRIADTVRIIYGGSVKPSNSDSLFQQPDVDGFLVGGASLLAKDFVPIVVSCQSVAKLAK